MGLIRKVLRSVERDGVAAMFALCIKNLRRHRRDGAPNQFDREFGVETETWVDLGDLRIDARSYIWGCGYAPTPVSVFDKIMTLLPRPESYTFVDLGSGKGRVVMMAARQPFRAVIGVEFSPELCSVALLNLAKFSTHVLARDVCVKCEDVALFAFPLGPLIVYCYNPFTSGVLAGVLKRLARREAETIFVYYNPQYKELFTDFELMHAEDALCLWRVSGSS